MAVSERAAATLRVRGANVAMVDALAEMRALQEEAQTLLDVPAEPVDALPQPPAKPWAMLSSATQTLQSIGQSDASPAPASASFPGLELRKQVSATHARSRAAYEQLKERRLALKERLRLARERLAQLLQEMAQQTFEDGQQARVHCMALRQRLIDEGYNPQIWRCNRYSCDHPTPNDCSAPQFGGVWLIEPGVDTP